MRRTRQGSYPTSVTSHAAEGAEGQNPSRSGPTKRRGWHVIGAEDRWRELRVQGAQIEQIEEAARAASSEQGAWMRCERKRARSSPWGWS